MWVSPARDQLARLHLWLTQMISILFNGKNPQFFGHPLPAVTRGCEPASNPTTGNIRPILLGLSLGTLPCFSSTKIRDAPWCWNMITNIYPKMKNVDKQYQHYVGSKNNVSKITYDRVHYQSRLSGATYHNWLVVYLPTPLKNMSSSVEIMKIPIYGKIKFMFQTTNQIILLNRINS